MPTQELCNTVKQLERAVTFSGSVSMLLTGLATDRYGELCSIIHGRIWANAHSLVAVIKSRVIDHSAILSLSRMILEAFIAYRYIDAKVSDDERDCRYQVLKLHDTCSRINLMSIRENRDSYQDLIDGRAKEREELKRNPFFESLLDEQKERALSGTQAYIRGMRRAAVDAGFHERTFNSIYGYLSGHTHSLPISVFRVSEHKVDYFDPSPTQIGMATLGITLALPCLLAATFSRIDDEPDLHASWREGEAAQLRELLRESVEGLIQLGS